MVNERSKAFAAAHRNGEDRQAYISASRHASTVIAKAKAEAWQATCSSLSLKSNSKSMYFLFRSVDGSFFLIFLLSQLPQLFFSQESASVLSNLVRSHFSVSQPNALRSRARGYVSELSQATCSEKFHLFFCSPFFSAEFLGAVTPILLHCHWPRQSCLPHAKAPSSLWH